MAKQNRKHPELVKMFDSLSGSKGAWEVWNDVITMFAISISNSLDIKLRKKKREEMYMNIIKKYSSEEHKIITKICVEIARIFEKNFEQDLLGDLYMDLDFGSNALGQFFTPYSVCQAMAETTFDKEYAQKIIEDNGYIKINEPACGAGANIIALANQMKKQEINYQESAFFVAQDLSQLTAFMCYIQLSLLGIAAIVVIGDTLEKPFYANTQSEIEISENIWLTPMYYSDIWCVRRNAKLMDELLM
ncbi:MAG: SAM-dependent DNA methyltransferase [Eubacterium sp.]|nr:SAM-dependent DNA methyltransferase [Eubacterium sp.]